MDYTCQIRHSEERVRSLRNQGEQVVMLVSKLKSFKTLSIRWLQRASFCAALSSFGVVRGEAQNVCPASAQSGKLICILPQLYGPNGLQLPNPQESSHFSDNYTTDNTGLPRFSPLSTAIGTQLTSLPLPSPASGLTFVFDPSTGLSTQTAESLGPLLAERAETIGRHRLYVSVLYEHYSFGSVDGINLKSVPLVFQHNKEDSSALTGDQLDYLKTSNRINLKSNQVIADATFGLTSRIDVSLAIPITNISYGVSSTVQIVRNSGNDSPYGYFHFFDASCLPTNPPPTAAQLACQAASTTKTFTNSSNATGVGDIIARVKANVFKGERLRAAVGLDLRLPTGDVNNFLGAGSTGIKPFVALSYRAKVSPHVNLGYEWNGDSILAGNVLTGTKSAMPSQFLYSGGVDWGVFKRFTAAFDLVGQRYINANEFREQPFVDINGTTVPNVTTTSTVKGSFNINDLSIGGKVAVGRKFLISANLLVQLNDAGIRSRLVPMIGLSYAF